jgi:hypothetical protein
MLATKPRKGKLSLCQKFKPRLISEAMSTVVKTKIHEFPRPAEIGAVPSRSQFFFNRELSLLEFHARVLEEALDDSNPLLERLKFLSIFSSNLDEFFQIRVSGLKEELEDRNVVSDDGAVAKNARARDRARRAAGSLFARRDTAAIESGRRVADSV